VTDKRALRVTGWNGLPFTLDLPDMATGRPRVEAKAARLNQTAAEGTAAQRCKAHAP
jgi:hypothetical protein